MATKKHKQRSWFDLWDKVRPEQLYAVLVRECPDRGWRISGEDIAGTCGKHHETEPSLHISFRKKIIKCFSCEEEIWVDLVSFLTSVLKFPTTNECLLWMNQQNEFNLDGYFSDSDIKSITAFYSNQAFKRAFAKACQDTLLEYLRNKSTELSYFQPGVDYLLNGRKLSVELFTDFAPIAIFPKPVHVKKHLDAKYHLVYEDYFNKELKNNDGSARIDLFGSILFWYNSDIKNISQFKLIKPASNWKDVLPSLTQSSSKAEYRQLFPKSTNSLFIEDSTNTNGIGFYGLEYISRKLTNQVAPVTDLFVTEGEFDFLSFVSVQLENGKHSELPCIACGGSAQLRNMGQLLRYGVRNVWLVFDSPDQKGENLVEKLLKHSDNYVVEGEDSTIDFHVYMWEGINDCDLDDLVRLISYEELYNRFVLERNSNFLNSYSWVLLNAQKELDIIVDDSNKRLNSVDIAKSGSGIEIKNIKESRKKALNTIGSKWIKLLYSVTDKEDYNKFVINKYDIDVLSQFNLSFLQDSTNASIALCSSIFSAVKPGYSDGSKSTKVYVGWDVANRETVRFDASCKELDFFVCHHVCPGKMFLNWGYNILGEDNPLLSIKSTENVVKDNKCKSALLFELVKGGISTLLYKFRNIDSLKPVRQGIHYSDIPEVYDSNSVVVLNGNRQFRGVYLDPPEVKGSRMEWEELNTLVYGSCLFKNRESLTWSDITDVADFNSALSVNLRKLYEDVLTCVDGWTFERHQLIRKFLAAYIISVSIQAAVGSSSILSLEGEHGSGKTSFQKLIGGKGTSGSVPYIVESVTHTDDPTAASLYQSMTGSSQLFAIDEAESGQESQHSRRIYELLKIIYGVPFGSANVNRGGPDGEPTSYNIVCPIFMTAINIYNDPVFTSRTILLKTKKDLKHVDIAQYIRNHFSDNDIKKMRKDITRCLIPYLPYIKNRMPSLKREMEQLTFKNVTVPDRFRTITVCTLACAELFGENAINIYNDLVEYSADSINNINESSNKNDIIDYALYKQYITVNENNMYSKLSVATLLSRPKGITFINESGSGVYYLHEKKWFVFVWSQLKYSAAMNPANASDDTSTLFDKVKNNPYVHQMVTEEENAYVIGKLRCRFVNKPTDYTIIEDRYLSGTLESSDSKPVEVKPSEIIVNFTFQDDEGDSY